MLLLWHIGYLDTRDKHFKGRNLWLDTDSLDPVTKAAVEFCHQSKDLRGGRDILRYRHLYTECCFADALSNHQSKLHATFASFCIPDYFEDETGQELDLKKMAVALTGKPSAVMFPSSASQHDIEFALAQKWPISIDQVAASVDDLSVLGYFSRDITEMLSATFFREGPGTLTSSSGVNMTLQTAASDEEIRSFITIFRRLYMQTEPANFQKAAAVFARLLSQYPLGKWIGGVFAQYEADLQKSPDFVPLVGSQACTFTRKRLIDVFLYTKYAHQPDERRTRQFQECLMAVGGYARLLGWLFLNELWRCSLCMRNAGIIIADFYARYCQYHQQTPDVLSSLITENPGLGQLEKHQAKQERLFKEKVDELAKVLWQRNGCPAGGPNQFISLAHEQLRTATGNSDPPLHLEGATCP